MFEQFEPEAVCVEFNALELFDGNADAKALHGASFGPRYAPNSRRVTINSMWVGYECHQKACEDRQELPGIEVMAVRCFK